MKRRNPTHPGAILLEDFLRPKGMSQLALAAKMGVSVRRLSFDL
jgi:plasmid maintenance system antidote protein VapI